MKYILILGTLILSACASLPSKYDSTEMNYYVALNAIAVQMHVNCGSVVQEHELLQGSAATEERLVEYLVAADATNDSRKLEANAERILAAVAPGIATGSKTFCQDATDNLSAGYQRIERTIARRQR
ncbi:MAG: hypothetical protein ACYDBH_00435 [Acidobacteriaceae bacterium]